MIINLLCIVSLSLVINCSGNSHTGSSATSDPYDEVPLNHWSYRTMQYIKQEGIIGDYPMEYAGRTEPLLRYQMAQGVIRFLNELAYEEKPIPAHIQIIAAALRYEYEDQLSQRTGIAMWPGKVSHNSEEIANSY